MTKPYIPTPGSKTARLVEEIQRNHTGIRSGELADLIGLNRRDLHSYGDFGRLGSDSLRVAAGVMRHLRLGLAGRIDRLRCCWFRQGLVDDPAFVFAHRDDGGLGGFECGFVGMGKAGAWAVFAALPALLDDGAAGHQPGLDCVFQVADG